MLRRYETTLYGKGVHGTNVWKIWAEDNVIKIHANGAIYEEVVMRGLASRSLDEQVELRVNARIRSKLDGGFKRTKEELKGEITNQLGLVAPMLATPLKNVRNVKFEDCFVQPKLDGHRCLINSDGAYSRRGKVIETIPEVLSSLDIPEGITLDGELYCHGVPLQTIASWAKRRQRDTLRLKFHVYDIIGTGEKFSKRYEDLIKIVKQNEFVELVETTHFNPEQEVYDYYRHYRDSGYEGAILRPEDGGYEIGKRSKKLIKVKMRYDGEYLCKDIIPSRDGWGIAVLMTPEGREFKTLCPGDVHTKKKTLDQKNDFIGRHLTCEYAELSLDKVPQHCVAIRWREDI